MKELDHNLLLLFNQNHHPFWDFVWTLLTDKFLAIPFIGLIMLFIWKKSTFKTTLLVGLFLIGLLVFTDLFSSLIKNYFQRPRPCSINSDITTQVRVVADSLFKGSLVDSNAEKCEKFSFFSAHAAVSFAIAVFLASLIKGTSKFIFGLILAWAFLVSVSRIYLGFHYPSDIFVGAIAGSVFGFVFFKIYQYFGDRAFSAFYFNPSK